MFLGGNALKKEINIEIGRRVHQARVNAHMSREDLAEKLNISPLFLGYIECGQKGMSFTTLKKICLELNISADYILLGISDNETTYNNIQILLSHFQTQYLPLVELQLDTLWKTIQEIEKNQQKSHPPNNTNIDTKESNT